MTAGYNESSEVELGGGDFFIETRRDDGHREISMTLSGLKRKSISIYVYLRGEERTDKGGGQSI